MDLSSLSRPGWVPALCGVQALAAYALLRQDERIGRTGLVRLSLQTGLVGGLVFWQAASLMLRPDPVLQDLPDTIQARQLMAGIAVGLGAWGALTCTFLAWRLAQAFEMLWEDAARSAGRVCVYVGAASVMVATVRIALG